MPTRSLKVLITGDERDLKRALASSEKGLDRFNVAIGNSTHETKLFSNSLSLVKPAAMITGVGLAAQALVTLGAGAVAAGAALAPLSGALVAYPALGLAAAQGMGVFKLATEKVFPVVGGLNSTLDKSTRAFKDLTPEAKKFAIQLDDLKKPLRDLPALAQKGLLPGLATGIKDASRNLPVLKGLVTDTAKAMGGLAVSAGTLVGSKGFGKDLATQGERNVGWIKIGGEAGLHLADALRHVILAAGPLVDWMAKGALQISRVVDQQAKAGRESGKLAGFFDQTRIAMSRVVRIGADLATAFFNVAKAGKPLGDDILVGLVRAADQFRKFTASASGKNSIATFFAQARPGVFELGRLLRDVTLAFGTLGAGNQIAPLLAMIRTQLLPVFVTLVQSTTAAFGPPLIAALGNIARLFGSLGGSSGPLILFVKLVGAAAGFLADIVQKNPALQGLLVTFAGLAAVIKAVKFAGMITGITTVVSSMRSAGVATKAWAAAQWLLNVALDANPIGLVVIAVAALTAGFIIAYKSSAKFRAIVSDALDAVKGAAATAFNWIKGHWPLLLGILTGPVGLAVGQIVSHLDAIKAAVSKAFSSLVSTVKGLAGRLLDGAKSAGAAIVNGIMSGLGNLGHMLLQKVKDAVGFVTGAVKNIGGAIGKAINPFGDGIGKPAASSGGGGGSSGLMGARSSLGPFAKAGARFGLRVSSGRRPGAITSSGNVSYHSTGEAIDEAGSPSGMMGFFEYMKSVFGNQLAELIYGPGKVGIKNGQPYNFGPALNAQHMDHVHVAYDSGAPGVGDGTGRPGRFAGDGIGQIKSLWVKDGGSAGAANMAAAIAMAESGGNAGISHRNSDGSIDRGLWQINSVHGAQSTFDRDGNAHAAISISGNGTNWRPWTTYTSGAYRKFLSAASGAPVSSGGASGSSGSSKSSSPFSGVSGFAVGGGKAASAAAQLTGPGEASGVGDALELAKAEAGSDPKKLLPVLMKEITLKLARLAKIKKALKGRMRAETRSRLTQEATTLVGELGDLWGAAVAVGAKGAPPKGVVVSADAGGAGGADAGGGAAGDSGAGGGTSADTGPTVDDQLSAEWSADQLTPGTDDDLATARKIQALRQKQFIDAQATGDPRIWGPAAEALKAANDQVTALEGNTVATTSLVDALKGVQASIDAQTAFAQGVTSTSNYQLTKNLADLLGGQIVGYGVAGRSFTPGTGTEYAYMYSAI